MVGSKAVGCPKGLGWGWSGPTQDSDAVHCTANFALGELMQRPKTKVPLKMLV